MSNTTVLIGLSFLASTFISQSAYGQGADVAPSFFWHIKNIIQDFEETITIDPVRKQELIAKHGIEEQRDIEKDLDKGLVIAPERFDRVDRKLEDSLNAPRIIDNTVKGLIDDFQVLADGNDIRICVSDFNKLRSMTDPTEKQTLAKQIDDRCNKLKSAQNNCMERIDSLELSLKDKPYSRLQEICPKLSNIPVEKAVDTLYGS